MNIETLRTKPQWLRAPCKSHTRIALSSICVAGFGFGNICLVAGDHYRYSVRSCYCTASSSPTLGTLRNLKPIQTKCYGVNKHEKIVMRKIFVFSRQLILNIFTKISNRISRVTDLIYNFPCTEWTA